MQLVSALARADRARRSRGSMSCSQCRRMWPQQKGLQPSLERAFVVLYNWLERGHRSCAATGSVDAEPIGSPVRAAQRRGRDAAAICPDRQRVPVVARRDRRSRLHTAGSEARQFVRQGHAAAACLELRPASLHQHCRVRRQRGGAGLQRVRGADLPLQRRCATRLGDLVAAACVPDVRSVPDVCAALGVHRADPLRVLCASAPRCFARNPKPVVAAVERIERGRSQWPLPAWRPGRP